MAPVVCLALLLPLAAFAAPREDYAQQWPLTLGRDDAGAYRVTLDESVYRQLRDPAAKDAVVINRDGVAVPTDVFAPEAPLAQPARRVALPWFALPSTQPGATAQGWELVSQADADGRLRRVEVRTRDAAAVLPRNALLVDVSRVHEAISALELQWQPLESLDLGYRVEASDDLEHWQVLATRGRMVDLTREGRRLLHRRIELYGLLPQYQQARYLRLTPDRAEQMVTITGVAAELAAARAPAVPKWIELTGPAGNAKGAAAVFEFDSAGRFPVQQVDVALPGNSAVEWTLESRDRDDADWRYRAGPWVAFQVGPGNAGTRSPPRELTTLTRDRYWRLRANTPVTDAPVLRLGYRPEVAVFLAQGVAPYALAAGSTRARRGDSPLPQLVAEMRRQRGADWQPAPAYLGTPQALAGEGALAEVRDWKSWLLWAVLGLGALVVAGFALALLRSQGSRKEPEAAQEGGTPGE
ncbi:DUF3999 domain-containing protein [Lysobacter terrestris]|uniref:DUF3999 domain-containing protein n=2 Tax=Agrilutibacter terrestris TaxID=2865112 RepID=A0A7H0G1L2_9GAMM|nr:DUF3999 domain-containing protein [Lysobacter terrestris]